MLQIRTYRALTWDPTLDPGCKAHRRHGRPRTRWTDDLTQLVQQTTATDDSNNNNNNSDNDTNNNHNNNNNNDDGFDDATHDDGNGWMLLAVDWPQWQEMEEQFVHRTVNEESRSLP